jgi:hypothetical protein
MVDGEEGEIEIVDSPVGARVSTYSRTCIIVPASVKGKKNSTLRRKGKSAVAARGGRFWAETKNKILITTVVISTLLRYK